MAIIAADAVCPLHAVDFLRVSPATRPQPNAVAGMRMVSRATNIPNRSPATSGANCISDSQVMDPVAIDSAFVRKYEYEEEEVDEDMTVGYWQVVERN